MQIAARGFPEVTRSKKTKNMFLANISRSVIVSNRLFIRCRRVCHASLDSFQYSRFYHTKWKSTSRNFKSAMLRYEKKDQK